MIDTALLDIVGQIYDAAIDPTRWPVALEAIRVRHGWYNSSFSIVALPQQTAVVNVALNIPDSMYEHTTIAQDIVAMWGGPERMAEMPLEEPLLQTDQTPLAKWVDYPFAREWALPLGIIDQVGIALARDRTNHALLGFAQHESMIVEPWMIDELRILAPHLRRAAVISRFLENAATRVATLEAALDATQTGAVLVRGDMTIVHANRAAEELLNGNDPIRSSSGRLQLTAELVPGHLDAAVVAAAQGLEAIGRRGIGIPARRADGSPLATHVLPLKSRQGRRLDADAVVFVAGTGGAEPGTIEILALIFELTPAEARAMELIALGQSTADAARTMGIAPSTLRTHLLRVYQKTGRHSRDELTRLVGETRLPG